MKVSELIEKLQECNPDADVLTDFFAWSDDDIENPSIETDWVTPYVKFYDSITYTECIPSCANQVVFLS